jgi:hypothetical protein
MRGDIRRVAESSNLFQRDLDFRPRANPIRHDLDHRAADFAVGNPRVGANKFDPPSNFKSSNKRSPHERKQNAGSICFEKPGLRFAPSGVRLLALRSRNGSGDWRRRRDPRP